MTSRIPRNSVEGNRQYMREYMREYRAARRRPRPSAVRRYRRGWCCRCGDKARLTFCRLCLREMGAFHTYDPARRRMAA